MPHRPTVILLEDDTAMRLYAQTALEDLDIELIGCESIAQATAAFDATAVSVLITDLRLHGECGIELIERIGSEPERFGRPKVVVNSAGLGAPGTRARLQRLGVWRLLDKAVSLEALASCVLDALEAAPGDGARAAPATCASGDTIGRASDGEGAVAEFFGGDRQLYAAYRRVCVARFANDVQDGDGWVRAADPAGLQRLAHNLGSVLRMLGHADAAAVALRLEALLPAGDRSAAEREWEVLRSALRRLALD